MDVYIYTVPYYMARFLAEATPDDIRTDSQRKHEFICAALQQWATADGQKIHIPVLAGSLHLVGSLYLVVG